MGKDVIIACDFSSAKDTFDFLDKFTEEKPFVKIGMELYYAEGPSIVKEIKKRGHKIFLDLKLHDIPNTVKKAMSVLSSLDVDMTNLHAAGTVDMMKAAVEGLTKEDGTRPILIAVTQLTSTSEERMQKELLINASINDTIVIFDRVRENARGKNIKEVAVLAEISNKSLTQTLSRSINTSITTFIMIFMLWLLGVASIRDFALPIMVGLISGTYSSVCISTELWYVLKRRFGKNKAA